MGTKTFSPSQKIRNFGPKMANFTPKYVFFVEKTMVLLAHLVPCWHTCKKRVMLRRRLFWVILVNMEISVILGHEKTKIHNIIDYGKIDVFSVRTIIHIKNKMMGHLI